LGVLDGTRILYLEVIESKKAMRFSARRGDRDSLHSSALGKAIAVQLPESEVRRILEVEGMPRLTSHTITDPDAFLRVLDEVRARGFSTDIGESEEEARCVAVPLRLPLPATRAAISVSSPAARFAAEDAASVAAKLKAVAEEIATAIGGAA
jgi:DNA-binding IclR family transcriptional regulator